MSVESIKNYRYVSDKIATGGQPTRAQLEALAVAGFEHIINLATGNEENYDEKRVAADANLEYTAIPVDWSGPTREDFACFAETLDRGSSEKMFIHCAANYRVTGFFGLYGMARLGWKSDKVEAFIAETWNPEEYPVWRRFIDEMKVELSR